MHLSAASPIDQVRTAVDAAFRRRLMVLAFDQLATALALVLGGAVCLLLFGTQILSWYWLLLLAAVGAVFAIEGVRRRMISRYRVAQIVDRRLQLNDLLSTAWFLTERQDGSLPFAETQIERASGAACQIAPTLVFPLKWQRTWALTGALAAVACGLFALRYLVTSSLDVRESLIPIDFSFPARVLERLEKPLLRPIAKPRAARDLADTSRGEKQTDSPKSKNPDAIPKLPDPQAGKPIDSAADRALGGKTGNPTPDDQRQDGRAEGAQPNSKQPGEQSAQERPPDSTSRNEPSPDQKNRAGESQTNNGLMDRMKDALSSMMAKMAPQGDSRSQKESGRESQDQKSGAQSAAEARQGEKQSDANNAKSDQQSEGAQTEGQATEKSQAGQSRASNESSGKKGADAQSGIGRQDGEKSIKEAEQLRAAGKLAEIIGKRSAELTGDATVETSSGPQQLKTKYSNREGRHADLGGEINREEIPAAYQQYVREYMQQVRKPAGTQ